MDKPSNRESRHTDFNLSISGRPQGGDLGLLRVNVEIHLPY